MLKRLKNADAALTPDMLERMRRLGRGMLGRDYDRQFRWSDTKLYCSEPARRGSHPLQAAAIQGC